MEELAERGAAFLCADLDLALEPREDHAAYIANWLDVLKADNRARSSQRPATRSGRLTSSTVCSQTPAAN
jgi:antirestriction protein ArdC